MGTREKEGARESERTSSGSFKGNVTGSIVVCVVVLYFISISHCKAVEKACKKKEGGKTRDKMVGKRDKWGAEGITRVLLTDSAQ